MLTRMEISGFKSFEDFVVDLKPFLVVVGPNASGKSNLFDAIRLVSLLAGTDLRTAVQQIRGEPHELFRVGADGLPGDRMRFAVEVLLAPRFKDPWGAVVNIKHTRVRYEVEIQRRKDERGIERLVVASETARPILQKNDEWSPDGCKSTPKFKKDHLKYARTSEWLRTKIVDGVRRFEICQDGHQGRQRPAEAAEATVLSSINSAEFPHLFGLREELRSWRFLQLDPGAMRRASPTIAPDQLEPDGSNLASVLARIRHETATEGRPQGTLADIAIDLAGLIAGIVSLEIVEDVPNREYRIEFYLRDAPPISARVVSDGTLRVLAFLTILHDPKHRGLICFEEPENGIHPGRLSRLIGLIRDLLGEPFLSDADANHPLAQILLNTHSPVFLSKLESHEQMFADMVDVADPIRKNLMRRTRIRPIKTDGQRVMGFGKDSESVASYEVDSYLATVDRDV